MGEHSHSLAGIFHVVVPACASTGAIPQKRAIGGAGRSPAMRDRKTPRPSVLSQISWDSTSPATGRSYGWGDGQSGSRRRGGFFSACSTTSHGTCTRGRIAHRVLVTATRRPASSVTSTSDTPVVLPAWISRPLAVSVPLCGATVRRDLSEISAGVNGGAGGKAVWTAHPNGASARTPRVAPETTPWGNSSQPGTGMVNVTPAGSPGG